MTAEKMLCSDYIEMAINEINEIEQQFDITLNALERLELLSEAKEKITRY